MTEYSKIARPYAKAVFLQAEKTNSFSKWSVWLKQLSHIAQDPHIVAMMKNPKMSETQLCQFIIDVAGDELNQEAVMLVKLLSQYKRLICLPDIATLYETYRAEKEQVIDVVLTSAISVDKEYQEAIQAKLSERLNCQIKLVCETNAALIGGAVIRAGDYVIDGSVKGRLAKLKESIVTL